MRFAVALASLAASAFADDIERLPDKHAPALHRVLAREPRAQRLLVPGTCLLQSRSKDATIYSCKARGCHRACGVIEATAEVRVNPSGILSVRDVRVVDVGDTGECGCCM